MELLLKEGRGVNPKFGGIAVVLADAQGHDKVVKLLLDVPGVQEQAAQKDK